MHMYEKNVNGRYKHIRTWDSPQNRIGWPTKPGKEIYLLLIDGYRNQTFDWWQLKVLIVQHIGTEAKIEFDYEKVYDKWKWHIQNTPCPTDFWRSSECHEILEPTLVTIKANTLMLQYSNVA